MAVRSLIFLHSRSFSFTIIPYVFFKCKILHLIHVRFCVVESKSRCYRPALSPPRRGQSSSPNSIHRELLACRPATGACPLAWSWPRSSLRGGLGMELVGLRVGLYFFFLGEFFWLVARLGVVVLRVWLTSRDRGPRCGE